MPTEKTADDKVLQKIKELRGDVLSNDIRIQLFTWLMWKREISIKELKGILESKLDELKNEGLIEEQQNKYRWTEKGKELYKNDETLQKLTELESVLLGNMKKEIFKLLKDDKGESKKELEEILGYNLSVLKSAGLIDIKEQPKGVFVYYLTENGDKLSKFLVETVKSTERK